MNKDELDRIQHNLDQIRGWVADIEDVIENAQMDTPDAEQQVEYLLMIITTLQRNIESAIRNPDHRSYLVTCIYVSSILQNTRADLQLWRNYGEEPLLW